MVWETVKKYGLLELSANELRGNEKKRLILAGVMTALEQPITDLGCSKCFADALNELKRLNRQRMAKKVKAKAKQKDRMVKGPNFYLHPFGWVNSENCTDELAEKIIAKNPANAYLFNE